MTLMKRETDVPKSLHIIVQQVFSLDRDLISNSIVMLSPEKSWCGFSVKRRRILCVHIFSSLVRTKRIHFPRSHIY